MPNPLQLRGCAQLSRWSYHMLQSICCDYVCHAHDQSGIVCEAIHRTQDWPNSNSVLLNAEKTVVMNTS